MHPPGTGDAHLDRGPRAWVPSSVSQLPEERQPDLTVRIVNVGVHQHPLSQLPRYPIALSAHQTLLHRAAFSASSTVGGWSGISAWRPWGRRAPAARAQFRSLWVDSRISGDRPDAPAAPPSLPVGGSQPNGLEGATDACNRSGCPSPYLRSRPAPVAVSVAALPGAALRGGGWTYEHASVAEPERGCHGVRRSHPHDHSAETTESPQRGRLVPVEDLPLRVPAKRPAEPAPKRPQQPRPGQTTRSGRAPSRSAPHSTRVRPEHALAVVKTERGRQLAEASRTTPSYGPGRPVSGAHRISGRDEDESLTRAPRPGVDVTGRPCLRVGEGRGVHAPLAGSGVRLQQLRG